MRAARRSCLIVVVCLVFSGPVDADNPSRPSGIEDLTLEVAALQSLHELQLTPEQAKAFARLAQGAAGRATRSQEPNQVSPAYRKAVSDLYDALRGGDDDRATTAREKLDTLTEKEATEVDVPVSISDTARRRSAEALQLLNVGQVGTLLGTLELTDPGDLLADALDEVRGAPAAERKEEIERVTGEVAWLVAGSDAAAARRIQDKARALLTRAIQIGPDDAFQAQLPDLKKSAHEVVGKVEPLQVVKHALEQNLAELLSNPRLEAALKARAGS
jgi:hypothetical protein